LFTYAKIVLVQCKKDLIFAMRKDKIKTRKRLSKELDFKSLKQHGTYLGKAHEVLKRTEMTCTRTVLLGAEEKGLDVHSNYQRTNELRSDLLALGLSFVGVSKVQSGNKSQIFMVKDVENVDQVRTLARKYGKKAVLVVDTNKVATVVSTSKERTNELGRLVQVDKAEAVQKKLYLTFYEDGKDYYFITSKE
jgi:hypothetical protein